MTGTYFLPRGLRNGNKRPAASSLLACGIPRLERTGDAQQLLAPEKLIDESAAVQAAAPG